MGGCGGSVDESALLLDDDGGSDDGSSWEGNWEHACSDSAGWGWGAAAAGGGGGGCGGAPKSLGASRREREIAASEVMLRSLRMIENMSGLEGDGGGGRGGL